MVLVFNFMLTCLISVRQIVFTSQEKVDCGRVNFQEHITNVSFYKNRIGIPPTAQFLVNYNITFKQNKFDTILAFDTDLTYKKSYRDTQQCFRGNIENILIFSQYYTWLSCYNVLGGCKKEGDYCICSGIRKFYIGVEEHWWIMIAYKCRHEGQELDLYVDMEFQCSYPVTCEKLSNNLCEEHLNFNYTAYPNALGQLSQQRANFFFDGLILQFIKDAEDSYKYVWEFMCYSLYPKCHLNKPIMLCRETCEDFILAWQQILDSFSQPIYCGSYPSMIDNDECFYEPVICSTMKQPRFGQVKSSGNRVHNTSRYVCNNGYELEGNTIRHCMYSGRWNGSEPVCVQSTSLYITKVVLPVCIVLTCVILITLVLCIKYRYNIKLILAYNGFMAKNFYSIERQKQPLFLTYSSEDRERVDRDLLPKMKLELYDWKIVTYQEDFIAGESIITNITKAIKESKSAVVLLTQNYIDSHWCQLEFT